MKRTWGILVGFILIFVMSFFAMQKWLVLHPLPIQQSYCCAQEGFYKKFNLVAPQQEQLVKMDEEFLREKNRLCATLCQVRYEMAQLLREPTTQQAGIDAKIAEIAVIQLAMERQSVAHVLKVRDLLTAREAKQYLEVFYQDLCKGIRSSGCGFSAPDKDDASLPVQTGKGEI